MKGLETIKERAAGVFGGMKPQFEAFEISKPGGYEEMIGKDGTVNEYGERVPGSPDSFEEVERPPLRKIDKYCKAECPCLPARFTIAVMACIGFMISFGMRCNMSAAKLKLEKGNGTLFFNWTAATESHVDSSFFWGYLITQIPGGFIASKFAANKIFGLAIVSSASLHLFVPFAMELLRGHIVIWVRVLQGIFEGVTYPACHGIWRFWAPPLERSRLATLAFSGSYAGVVVGLPLSGILAQNFTYGAPFYAYGIFGITWYLFWLWLCFENPRKHPTISIPELKYIEKSLGEVSTHTTMPSLKTTPWNEMMRSMPVYAIIVANFCRSWNFYLLVLYQSAFLNHKFGYKVEEAGFVGSIPHLIMTIIVPFGGMLADYLRKNNILTTTTVRKLFNCGGFGMEGLFFLVVAHAKTPAGAVTALTFGVAFSGFAISGYNVNHLDIAPRYASILMGLSNGIGTFAGVIVPYAIEGLIHADPKGCWTTVFTIAATVHLIGCTFYGVFASGELQPWAEPVHEEKQIWSPTTAGFKETTFNQADETSQMQQQGAITYGATGNATVNPFGGAPTAPPGESGTFFEQHYDQPPQYTQEGVIPQQQQQQYVAPSSNPFANTIAEEPIQPPPTGSYMPGTTYDQTY
ncbi:vesicular glutamate transporter 1 [Condylostylus longicornis]|uniref:vesicular glutamate transporter 1 n=1 Tax=Condylostylus longicornis TaxID=2530218 RepID=UPI00244DAF1B|nr:vesicular glutamate transporter 1 [Condylostylus longicornis]XP_055385995.1 vesicular glutamate transporter 1 [Condylostylus longicornis]XP_055385996.1 vesicular glutamate transporter 1 [Condylostylus longicornis]XP_055385997.1 vesicular glutamate transporter 1 [Condylostylus longicornis]XP_055385998.1 vesicular glutamate transporter 1 [Condylostylus longicornis]XP_055386000.1 vesicular glutamate transporter 1 [Condylostylus longicornis]XP_055386001.1 vesicular glutamate transporter 1 [Con